MTKRFPNGTFCGGLLPLVVLLMPYALIRYAIDRRRTRRQASAGPRLKVVGMGPFPLPGEKRRHERAVKEARRLLSFAEGVDDLEAAMRRHPAGRKRGGD